MLYVILILTVLLFVMLAALLLLKKEIRNLSKQLKTDKAARKLTVSLMDKDLTELASAINQGISAHNESRLAFFRREVQLRENIANISHDLRTPLTSIKGYLQLLDKMDLNEAQREYLAIALKKAGILSALIDDFYTISYWDSNKAEPNMEKIDLCAFMSDCILDNHVELEEKGFTPEFRIPAFPLFIFADAEFLRRAVQNLVSNAIRHGEGKFAVDIESKSDNAICLRIENGFLNSADIDIARVFDRFYTFDKSRGESATGLGLAIAKLLVEKMRGEITARIAGDCFVVELRFDKVI